MVELNDSNNTYTNPTNLVVTPVQSSDLVGTTGVDAGQPGRPATRSPSPRR